MNNIIVCLLCVLSICAAQGISYAQTKVSEKTQGKLYSNFPIVLSIKQADEDQVGTDVENTYIVSADFQSNQYRNKNAYTIMYILDSMPLAEFKNQTLPFSVTRNYTGLLDGVHQVRIDVEDGNGHVLATSTIPVTVKHLRRK